jgi:hypothetical protein
MDPTGFEDLLKEIVREAQALKDAHTNETDARVNYACVFAKTDREYADLLRHADNLGRPVRETPTGPLYLIPPLQTSAGPLRLLKIRTPDVTHFDRGDADFTVSDYAAFKHRVLSTPGFSLIVRAEGFEMVELMDPAYRVRAYFSNHPLDEQLGV